MRLIPNRLSDMVAVAAGDPARLAALGARLPRLPGWHRVAAPPGWLVAMRGMGEGAVPERCPYVLEGWPDLYRWRGSPEAGHEALSRSASAGRWSAVPGDVSYAQLRPHGAVTLVRAPAARVPIYVHRAQGALFVATRMDLMLALRPDWPWRIDGMVALSWTGAEGVLPPGRTSIEGVRLVPAGHALEIDLHGAAAGRLSRYWDPRPAALPRRFDEREHAQALREAVLDHLDVELDPEGRNLLSLSLGVDSSTLAALTGRALGRGYSAISVLPTNPIDRLAEEANIGALNAVAAPTHHFRCHVGDEELTELPAHIPTSGVPILHPVLLELPRLRRELDLRTLFGGEWGDAACGDRVTIPDWLAEAPVAKLLFHQTCLPVGEREVLDALARRALRMLPLDSQVPLTGPPPTAARAELRDELETWDAELLAQGRTDRRPRLRLWYELQMEYWLLQNWEVASSLDVRRVTPFYQRRVLELAFSAPPQALIGPHVKKPLRRAFAADVPVRLLWRDKGVWPHEPEPGDGSWPRDLPAELSEIVREDWLPRPPGRLPFVDRLALAGLESYALSLRALRSAVTAP